MSGFGYVMSWLLEWFCNFIFLLSEEVCVRLVFIFVLKLWMGELEYEDDEDLEDEEEVFEEDLEFDEVDFVFMCIICKFKWKKWVSKREVWEE